MPYNVYFVLSAPPEGVSDADYDAFYELHVTEILQSPGWMSARRYWLVPGAPDRPDQVFRHLSVYVLDRPSEEPLADLGRRRNEMTMPDWFDDIRFLSFEGRPLEDDEIVLPDHGYLVLSHAPERFNTEEYYGWYYAHARENCTSDGFERMWRYALTPSMEDDDAPGGRSTHAAWYEVEGELPALREALAESARARRVDIPAWMPEGDFVSFDSHAPTAEQTAVAGAAG
jgi:hypothetical protein